jgi:hypothetical protein
MRTIVKCLLVLVLTCLLIVALPGVGLSLGALEVTLLLLGAVVVMALIVWADRRARAG